MGSRGVRIGAALGLPVVAAGAVFGALALAGPSDAAHSPATHGITPASATNTTTSSTDATPGPGPATASNSSSSGPPSSTTTSLPSQPAPAIGAPANSSCGGVCGAGDNGASGSSGNGQ